MEQIELLDRKGYLTIALTLNDQLRILLRKPEGIRDWHQNLEESIRRAKERKGLLKMKSTKEFWSRKQFTDSSSMEQWVKARRNVVQRQTTDYGFIDSPVIGNANSPVIGTPVIKDSASSTFSHDSGVDSMNTNSSGKLNQSVSIIRVLDVSNNRTFTL